jgi:hypothetical protein
VIRIPIRVYSASAARPAPERAATFGIRRSWLYGHFRKPDFGTPINENVSGAKDWFLRLLYGAIVFNL